MIQYYVNYDMPFTLNRDPRIEYVSHIQKGNSYIPRLMHKHKNHLEINFVINGSSEYYIGNKKYPINKGDIIIINSNTLHDDVPSANEDLNYYCLSIGNLNYSNYNSNCLIPDNSIPIFKSGQNETMYNNLYNTLFNLISSYDQNFLEVAHYTMMSILKLTINLIENNKIHEIVSDLTKLEIYKQVREYIDVHYFEDLSLDNIASTNNISPYYLSHIFKKYSGYSPMQYILLRRIGEAQSLMMSTNKSITDIALEVGYDNPNNFDIMFSRKVGMSPTQFKKMYLGKTPKKI